MSYKGKIFASFLGVVFAPLQEKPMNKYDNELLKNSPSMIKGIAVEADKLNGGHYLSLTLDDVRGMTEFRLALGGQISEADKVYRKIAGNI